MDSQGRSRGRGTSRLCMCFRPIVLEYGSDPGGRRVVAIDSEEDEGEKAVTKMVIPKILTLGAERLKGSPENSARAQGGGRTLKREKLRRGLSRVVNSVLFETNLVRKVRSRKARNSKRSEFVSPEIEEKSNSNSEAESRDFSERRGENGGSGRSGDAWPVLDSSSSSCASLAEKGWFGEAAGAPSTESSKPAETISSHNIQHDRRPACLLILCLFVLVVWGKVCAIFCTSACLFLLPRLAKRPADSRPRQWVDSPEQKKRVIMEGLLTRNRSWVNMNKTWSFERL